MKIILQNNKKLYKKGLFVALFCSLILSGCVTTNPATGKQQLSFVSEDEEYEIGHEIYGDTVKEGGGIYKENKKLSIYINNLLKKIVAVSERPNKPFKLTILDSEIYNAAAIPGYIFVNRGVLPYINNEAQLVAILGHEVGHITAQHYARRKTTATIANIGRTLLGAYISYSTQGASGGKELMQATDFAGQYLFASYSRSFEEESDSLAVRYLTKLKYNPYAASGAFVSMVNQQNFMQNIYKKAGIDMDNSIFHRLLSSHPEVEKRIKETAKIATQKGSRSKLVHRDRYLDAINGVAFGPKIKENGVAKKNIFIHPKHQFSFKIPDGYITPMVSTLPVAIGNKLNRIIDYNVKAVPEDEDEEESLIYNYPKIHNIKEININGKTAYTGIINENITKGFKKIKVITRIVGIKGRELKGDKLGKNVFYSIIMSSEEKHFNKADKQFMQIAKSIKLLTKKQAQKVEPLRIHIYTTKKGDTQKSVAEKMAFSADRIKWLRLINALKPTDKLLPNMRLKLIY